MPNEQFLQTLDAIINIYQHSLLSVAVTDRQLRTVWANSRAILTYPGLLVPDGLSLMLPYPASQSSFAQSLDEPGEPAVIPLPASGVQVVLTPIPGGYIVHFDHLSREGTALQPEGPDRLLSTFSNQMRAPLVSIFSALSLIGRDPEVIEIGQVPDYVQAINKNSYQLLRFSSDILRYIRHSMGTDSFSPVRLGMSALLRHLCDAAAVVFHEIGIPIELHLPLEEIILLADPDKLSVALLHLLSNACRFTREGNRIEIDLSASQDRVLLTVSDRGIGMPPAVQGRVFEPFYSFDHSGRSFAGAGLGLSIVRYCISRHGGSIALSSLEGQSTTVVIRLPLCDDPSLPVQPPTSAAGHLRDRFSNLHVILSDCCESPPP